jgi:hypothetical protein
VVNIKVSDLIKLLNNFEDDDVIAVNNIVIGGSCSQIQFKQDDINSPVKYRIVSMDSSLDMSTFKEL